MLSRHWARSVLFGKRSKYLISVLSGNLTCYCYMDRTNGVPMKLPSYVLAAKERMERADAALHAYIQETVADDGVRHIRLLDELQVATDDYVEKITVAVKDRIAGSLYFVDSHEGGFQMLDESGFDADPLAHDVVSVWRTASGKQVSENFKQLFDKMQAYREAKDAADTHRDSNLLTEQLAEQEKKTRNEFLDSYRTFFETRTNVDSTSSEAD